VSKLQTISKNIVFLQLSIFQYFTKSIFLVCQTGSFAMQKSGFYRTKTIVISFNTAAFEKQKRIFGFSTMLLLFRKNIRLFPKCQNTRLRTSHFILA